MSEDFRNTIFNSQKESPPNMDISTEKQEVIFSDVLKGRKRKKYSLQLKLEAIAYSKAHSVSATAKRYHCNRKRIRGWIQNEIKICDETKNLLTTKGKTRLSGAGRKEISSELNEIVLKWIEEARENRQRVSRRLLKLQANKIGLQQIKEGKLASEIFIASNGWLQKFMKRNGLTIRCVTMQCQKSSVLLIPFVSIFFYIHNMRLKRQYSYGQVYAADETAVWIDPAGRTCVTNKSAKEVAVRTTGHGKLHITVMRCARENGIKCLPFVFLPRKRPIPEIERKFNAKLILSWHGSVWMNQEQTTLFLNKVFGRLTFSNRLLV